MAQGKIQEGGGRPDTVRCEPPRCFSCPFEVSTCSFRCASFVLMPLEERIPSFAALSDRRLLDDSLSCLFRRFSFPSKHPTSPHSLARPRLEFVSHVLLYLAEWIFTSTPRFPSSREISLTERQTYR